MSTDIKRIARQRIRTILNLAEESQRKNPDLARRYVIMARKIAMGAKIRFPPEYRRQICRHCESLIMPGLNCRVRIRQEREPHIVVTCLNCGKKTRMLLRNKKEKLEA